MLQGVESVLLYYKYVDLDGQQEEIRAFFESLCGDLSLVGRIRVAKDGINATVGGRHSALLAHIEAVKAHPSFGKDIDFKLARSGGPLSAVSQRETGFDGLQISVCKEVVSLGGVPQCLPEELPRCTAPHLTPEAWHGALTDAQGLGLSKPVLLDARNVYETRIGRFEAAGADLVDPMLRQFGDLPAWLAENAERLRHRRVFMYCTGGVRCERASALLRGMGPEFENVFQLSGGIQRYMERFPDGGLFRGKNFVFDERVAVPPAHASPDRQAVGRCLVCHVATDDYGPRLRCSTCRMLVLICAGCAGEGENARLVCELCSARNEKASEVERHEGRGQRKLRILCLHGFRQTGNSLRQRLKQFLVALEGVAEFHFPDAPHALPFLYRPAVGREVRPLPTIDPARPRRAWLVETDQTDLAHGTEEPQWQTAPPEIGAEQFLRQSQGWSESSRYLRSFIDAYGPFDGILGFSQGATAAAAFCAEQLSAFTSCKRGRADNGSGLEPQGGASELGARLKSDHDLGASPEPFEADLNGQLRFAILCAGYAPRTAAFAHALESLGGKIGLASLHVFGARRSDRQVDAEESEALRDCFAESGRVVLAHRNQGHYLPVDKGALGVYRKFLSRFTTRSSPEAASDSITI